MSGETFKYHSRPQNKPSQRKEQNAWWPRTAQLAVFSFSEMGYEKEAISYHFKETGFCFFWATLFMSKELPHASFIWKNLASLCVDVSWYEMYVKKNSMEKLLQLWLEKP